jgi:hypothetical protein
MGGIVQEIKHEGREEHKGESQRQHPPRLDLFQGPLWWAHRVGPIWTTARLAEQRPDAGIKPHKRRPAGPADSRGTRRWLGKAVTGLDYHLNSEGDRPHLAN